jgi:PAS domain S-box-containing protein
MEDAQYKHLLHTAPFGFAYHKIIVNSSGPPIDYVFLEVNPAFEKLTGLKAEAVINQPVTTAIPALVNDDFDWIGFYGQVALTSQEKEFEQYAQSLQRWYKVHAYSPQPYYFSTTFVDITESVQAKETLREVNIISEYLIRQQYCF